MSTIPAIDMSMFGITPQAPAAEAAPAGDEKPWFDKQLLDPSVVSTIDAEITPAAKPDEVLANGAAATQDLLKDIHPSVRGLLSTNPDLEELEMAGRPPMTPEQLSFMVNKLGRQMHQLDGLGHQIGHRIEHVVENLLERIKHVDERVGVNALIALGQHMGNVAVQMNNALKREELIRNTRVDWLTGPSTEAGSRSLMIAVAPRTDGNTDPEAVSIRYRDPETQVVTDVTNTFTADVHGLVRTSALNNAYADGNFRWATITGPVAKAAA